MKRTMAALLCILLLGMNLPAAFASGVTLPFTRPTDDPVAADEPVAEDVSPVSGTPSTLKEAIEMYLDSQGLSYDYDEDKEYFNYDMSLNSSLNSCEVYIDVWSDGFYVYAYSPISPKRSDAASMAATAEFICRANYAMSLGNFEFDFRDGEIRYKTYVKCFDNIPTQLEIEWLVDIPPLMLEHYGDGLVKVIMMGADPAETITEIEG